MSILVLTQAIRRRPPGRPPHWGHALLAAVFLLAMAFNLYACVTGGS